MFDRHPGRPEDQTSLSRRMQGAGWEAYPTGYLQLVLEPTANGDRRYHQVESCVAPGATLNTYCLYRQYWSGGKASDW